MRNDTLFDSQNAAYAQAMFEEFARNPESVPAEWRQLFRDGGSRALAEGLLTPDQFDGHRAPPVVVAPPPAAAPATAARASTPAAAQ
ncbi:MAG: hypothetical protein FJ207_15170, partial [Gemmatimonadetes bacterium]|nr:hypothetical protein [Gemmatimonadota bacterium]